MACNVSEDEESLSIEFEALLLRSGKVLAEKRICRVWNKKRGGILPNYNRKKKDEKERK